MNITVILCTYNRCQSLAKALGSVAVSTFEKSVAWEVIVVDNNSNDHTRDVVEEYCRQYPGKFRYVFEPRQGKSFALTTGIHNAQGQILAFMDDDVIVEPGWLQNLTANLNGDQWVGAGGRILPEQPFSPPSWLPLETRYALAPFALFDLGPEPGRLAEAPFGTNMAFQRKLFAKYGGFRTDLGPCPGSGVPNEDTEFGQRILAAREPLRYEPSAVVYHPIPEKRMRKSYFLTWWFDKGRAEIRQSGIPPDARWYVAGIPLFTVRRLIRWTVCWLVEPRPTRRFANKINVWVSAGRIRECYRQSHPQTA